MLKPITLPSLGHFLNGNGWLGSAGLMRFQIENLLALPDKEQRKPEMTAVLWQGPFSRPYAQEIERQTFPVSEEGLTAVLDYLNAKAQTVNEAPPFTDAETMEYYRAKKAEEAAPKEA